MLTRLGVVKRGRRLWCARRGRPRENGLGSDVGWTPRDEVAQIRVAKALAAGVIFPSDERDIGWQDKQQSRMSLMRR